MPAKVKNSLPALSTLLLLLLAWSVPTNVYFTLGHGYEFPQRTFGFTEFPQISPHAEAEFLGRPGMPKRVFAYFHSLASACIFHNGPDQKVFVDGRLEVCTQKSYERWFQITDLLLTHDPAAEEMLLADVPPDAAGTREMPAVLLGIGWFLGGVENIVGHPRWRPVFCGDTAVVLMYEPDAQRRGIPAVDRSELRIHILRCGLELKPNSPNVHFKLGQALCRSDAAEAAEHFRRAFEIKPDFADAHYCYAALIASTQPESAEEHLRIAVHCDPTHAGACCSYANVLLRSGRYAEAIDLYRQALKINPKFQLARQNLALAQQRCGAEIRDKGVSPIGPDHSRPQH